MKITKVIKKLKIIESIDIPDNKKDLKWKDIYIKTNKIDPTAHIMSLLATPNIYLVYNLAEYPYRSTLVGFKKVSSSNKSSKSSVKSLKTSF